MLSGFILLKSLSLSIVHGQTCSTIYENYNVCDVAYGNVLETSEHIRSTVDCSTHCAENALCRSFTYNPACRTCKINDMAMLSPPSTCGSDVIYAEVIQMQCIDDTISTTTETASVSSASTTIAAATTASSSASAATSTLSAILFSLTSEPATTRPPTTTDLMAAAYCPIGTRYDPSVSACAQDCIGTYGTTFQYMPRRKMNPGSQNIHYNIAGPDECRQECLQDVGCKTFQLKYSACTLTDEILSPEKYEVNGEYDCWNRDCA